MHARHAKMHRLRRHAKSTDAGFFPHCSAYGGDTGTGCCLPDEGRLAAAVDAQEAWNGRSDSLTLHCLKVQSRLQRGAAANRNDAAPILAPLYMATLTLLSTCLPLGAVLDSFCALRMMLRVSCSYAALHA